MIINLSIISADTKKKEAEALAAIREAERIVYQAQRGQRVEKLVEIVFSLAEKTIKRSESLSGTEICISECDLPQSVEKSELSEALDVVMSLLKTAGYRIEYSDYYSDSWRYRSGKIFHFRVSWE